MKSIIYSLIFAMCNMGIAYAQTNRCDCSDALDKSLKDKYTESQLLDLRIELYEYYKFLKNKTQNTNASFDLSSQAETFTGYGVFSNSYSGEADYAYSKYQNLQKIIEKEQRISEEVFKKMAVDVFSNNQLEAYRSCLELCKISSQNGVFYEVTGDLEDIFAINLIFKNTVGKEQVTIANNATLVNCEPIGGLILKEGLTIKDDGSVTQYLKIINKEKPAQIGLNFKELSFGAINFGEEYIGNGKNLPIGTIISSTLKYSTFLEANRIKPTDNMEKAIWVPCDGRDVRASTYGKYVGSVPDLRGLFLRNVNDYNVPFDGVGKVKTERANPDNISAGIFQPDAFQGHKHFSENTLVRKGKDDLPNQPDQRPKQEGANNSAGVYDAGFGKPRISSETRPKNMTVYYYIKIN